MSASTPTTETDAKPPEFKRYRQVLAGIYLSVGALGSLLVLSSIVVDLFFHGGSASPEPAPADLLACNREVRALLTDLAVTSAEIQKSAATADLQEQDLGGRWEEFSRTWQRQWSTVNDRCQFDELADTGLGPAFDRMAWVHRRLPGLRLEYREHMKRFTENQADELAEMREALDKSLELLEQRAGTPP